MIEGLPVIDIKLQVRRNLHDIFPIPRLSMEELFDIADTQSGLRAISDTAIMRKLDAKEFLCEHGSAGGRMCVTCNPGTTLSKALQQMKRGEPIDGEVDK